VIQVGSFLNFDTTCLTETLLKITLYYVMQLSLHPTVRIPTAVNTIMCKLHLIHEQNVEKNLQPQLETFIKLYMDGVGKRFYTL